MPDMHTKGSHGTWKSGKLHGFWSLGKAGNLFNLKIVAFNWGNSHGVFFFVNVLNDTHRENFVLLYSVQEWLLGCFCVYIINYKFYTLRYQVQMFKKSDSSRQQK